MQDLYAELSNFVSEGDGERSIDASLVEKIIDSLNNGNVDNNVLAKSLRILDNVFGAYWEDTFDFDIRDIDGDIALDAVKNLLPDDDYNRLLESISGQQVTAGDILEWLLDELDDNEESYWEVVARLSNNSENTNEVAGYYQRMLDETRNGELEGYITL